MNTKAEIIFDFLALNNRNLILIFVHLDVDYLDVR